MTGFPLYLQLAQALRLRLRSGEIAPGEVMPSERELMGSYQVSRNTIRQAFDMLSREGLVERIQGKGTFASNPRLKLGLMRLTSFSEDMRERQMVPTTRLLAHRVEIPSSEIADQLELLPGEKAFYLERLRLADGIPMALNVSYFSISSCPGLVGEDLENGSIYAILEDKYGLQISRAEQVVRATPAQPGEAGLLEIPVGTPLLEIDGVVFLAGGRPIEVLRSIYRSDRYEFSIVPVRA